MQRIGIAAAFGFVVAAGLFAGDLTLRQYAGHGLFPYGRADRRHADDRKLAGAGGSGGLAAEGLLRSRATDRLLRPARQSDRTRPAI